MEDIIQKAIEGGYMPVGAESMRGSLPKWSIWNMVNGSCETIEHSEVIIDPLFWQSLGKACGWIKPANPKKGRNWLLMAIMFHEINLTEGWDKAIIYLQSLIK